MKNSIKKVISILMAIVTISSVSAVTLTASAANYSTNYSSYDSPENSGDYAYWNGKKVVKSSSTSKDEIRWMQAALNYCIKYKGLKASYLNIDGSFGPACKTATLAFQKKYGLSADGSFGPSTIKKMKSVVASPNPTSTSKATTSSKTLSINWDLIKTTGKQGKGEKNCLCRALAYSRDIIDGYAHSWTEYSVDNSKKWYGKEYRYSYTASCSKASYTKKTSTSQATVYKAIYDNINNGKPVVINVDDGAGKRSTGCHYVAVVGYKNVTNTSNLSASNFLIIDSVGNGGYTTENLGGLGYYLLSSNSSGKYTYYID